MACHPELSEGPMYVPAPFNPRALVLRCSATLFANFLGHNTGRWKRFVSRAVYQLAIQSQQWPSLTFWTMWKSSPRAAIRKSLEWNMTPAGSSPEMCLWPCAESQVMAIDLRIGPSLPGRLQSLRIRRVLQRMLPGRECRTGAVLWQD